MRLYFGENWKTNMISLLEMKLHVKIFMRLGKIHIKPKQWETKDMRKQERQSL